MNIIRFSIDNPVTVVVGVLLVVLFGVVSLMEIPVQLSPNVEQPVITVSTTWPGATPYEIERDIIEEQERRLKSIPGLDEMESRARNSVGRVTLRFNLGIDIDTALLRVSNKLDEVPSYPENVERPVVNASGAESSPVMWIVLKTLEDNDRNIYTYRTFIENEVRQFIERVEGVADLNIGGGAEEEMQVIISPERLAAYGLTIDAVVGALRMENANVSAGNMEVGRREYRVRTVAEYRSPEDIEQVVVLADGQRSVIVGDVADVQMGYARFSTPMISNHVRGISMGVVPEPGTNILNLTDAVEAAVIDLNDGFLKEHGVYLDIVNEQRPYIRGAIALLRQNIAIGGTMALIMLLLFLRSLAPTLVVSTTIPISIIGTFIFMYLLGSSLNIVSLAGIAFAVGMLVDNAIVVLENIDRHRNMGKKASVAAYDGTREVWGAVLASSLTTIAVFLPVVFFEDVAGQLFRDIAIAVTCAVALSLVSAMTVIPAMSSQVFRIADHGLFFHKWAERRAKKRKDSLIVRLGLRIRGAFMLVISGVLHNAATRLATIVLLVGGAVFTGYTLLPKAEYLPDGNRDLIINVLIPPPGISYEERLAIGEQLFAFFEPYFEPDYEGYPGIRNMFFVGRAETMILGVVSADQQRTRELMPLCREALAQIPGVFGISNQASLFGRGLGQGRTISVDLSGPNIERLVETGGAMMGMIASAIPGTQVRPVPALELLYPEISFVPDRERLRSMGMTAQQLGIGLDVLMDGRRIGDFKREGEKKVDLIVKATTDRIAAPEDLYNALIVVPSGQSVPVSSLARMDQGAGLTEIRHLEEARTVSLQVTPPTDVPLQEAMQIIEEEIVGGLDEQGLMAGIRFGMSGTADRLTETLAALQQNFLLAVLISYLLMAALLGNFLYPFVIMFTVPMAAAGGLIGLTLVNRFVAPQQFDVLTMLGFIILVGVVVNNAILIVYQSLNNIRHNGMQHKEAVQESVKTRLRPIYMSASTSIFGMLPLVLWPGPGSELYRGLGSVVLGGLALSTIFTVFLIPSILMFFIRWERVPAKEDADKEQAAASSGPASGQEPAPTAS